MVSASSTLDSVREATGAAVRGLLLSMPALLLVAVITWFATGRAVVFDLRRFRHRNRYARRVRRRALNLCPQSLRRAGNRCGVSGST
ncbi:hypothetical protein A8924_6731 [Saccharopolyspora erythraea NRRL 2338]|nr:hypothetical protein N599_05990 [Saccharopolyspora erythraea D]PFG99193.1 hypothetical protein A8924_6731 [Saccharopolyspora erythraea NRRL 2338]